MKLRDLDAFFIGNADAATRSFREQGDTIDGAQGLEFQCPKCAAGKPVETLDSGRRGVSGVHYVLVPFSNPRGAPIAYDDLMRNKQGQVVRWEMQGTGLHDLTTRPSILLEFGCAWHGFITNGDAQ